MKAQITLYVEEKLMDRETRDMPEGDPAKTAEVMNEIVARHKTLQNGRPWYSDFRYYDAAGKLILHHRVTPAPSGENYFLSDLTIRPAPPGQTIKAPGYWMNEQSGVLKPVVEKFLRGDRLDDFGIAAMRAYLRQWIQAEAWHPGPELDELRKTVPLIATEAALHVWLEKALEIGIDPL